VESCVDVFYLGRGWKEFLEVIDASKGDHILFEFTAARTCRVAVFNGKFGWQKYPYVDAQHEYTVLNPRGPSKWFLSNYVKNRLHTFNLSCRCVDFKSAFF
jgi:hypothetical protein